MRQIVWNRDENDNIGSKTRVLGTPGRFCGKPLVLTKTGRARAGLGENGRFLVGIEYLE
jgi:hypothetical protein